MQSIRPFQDDARRRGAVLRVMCLALMMVVASVASLNVALPAIARDTGASQTQLQWIVDAYALVFAGFLLLAGAIGVGVVGHVSNIGDVHHVAHGRASEFNGAAQNVSV